MARVEERSGPLTYGQLSVIRSLDGYGREGQHVANVVNVWRIPDGTRLVHVSDAWNQLVLAHESLRTTYDLSGPEPIQVVHPFRPAPLATVELDEDSVPAARAAAAPFAVDPIPIDRGVPWRVVVGTRDTEPVFFVAVIHHVAADHGASVILEAQFTQVLEGRVPSVQRQSRDVAVMQRAEPALRAVEHWVGQWPAFPAEDRDAGDGSPRRRASIYSRDGMEAARSASQQLRISIQSMVLGLGAVLLGKLLGRSEITFGMMAANRLDERWAGLVSSMNQCAPVVITVDPASPPQPFLQAVHVSTLTAYLNGCFDVDALSDRLAATGRPERDPTFFSKHYNFLGEVADEPAPGSALSDGVEWRSSTQRCGPNFHLVVATGAGLLLGVGASEQLLAGELPAVLARSIEAGLHRLVDGSLVSVGELHLVDSSPD